MDRSRGSTVGESREARQEREDAMKIRAWLAFGALVALAIGSAHFQASASAAAGQHPGGQGQAAEAPPRNIIFILVDDLRYDGMGFLQPEVKTPNIDQLARGGTYFPNTLVTTSLCSPSRATILTGETTRNHRVVDNNNSSEEGLVFFPSYLQKAGYQTAFIGKWHMGQRSDAPRPGFDKWVSFLGQGEYFPRPGLMLDVDGHEVPQKGYITDELTDYAMDWLQKERDPGKPFFLYLSHKAVHTDPLPAPRHAHQYDGTAFHIPASAANTPENYRGKPMWVYNQRNTWHGIDFFYNTDMKMTDYLKGYYATLSAVDDSVGRLLKYLRDNDLEKNTMIVFTSDNGFLIGDHGLIDKRNAYEGSVRIPMVVYAPGLVRAGATNPGRIRNLDFAPTFLDVAHVPMPPQFEGQSALPLMTGQVAAKDWHPGDFVYEYYWEWNFPMTPTTFAVERDRVKYIQYHGIYDLEELYDLDKDPDEMHNVIDDPSYLQTKITLRKALFDQLADVQGRYAVPFTERFSRGVVRRDREGTGAAPFPKDWLVEPNRPDKFNDMFPDSEAKLKAEREGKSLLPSIPNTPRP
jgi:arylsulfatase A-like enzyme